MTANKDNSNMAQPATNNSDNPANEFNELMGEAMSIAFTLQKLSNAADERDPYKKKLFRIAHQLAKAVDQIKQDRADREKKKRASAGASRFAAASGT
jgi:uncharacterized protein with ATP-grasp and redox domains